MNQAEGAKLIFNKIAEALTKKQGLLVGRFGTVECQSLFGQGNLEALEKNAGVFPADKQSVKQWCEAYAEAMGEADVLALGWYAPTAKLEEELLRLKHWQGSSVVLRSLEPYYTVRENRWTKLLEGRKVCVVSSFAETMKQQLLKREAVWGDEAASLLPSSASFSFVQTGYAPSLARGRASWTMVEGGEEIASWQDAVAFCVKEILEIGPEIILLGCGGLGMIIANHLRRRGKIVIVLGGAIQVLFGVKGERWATHNIIGKFWNEAWVWPALEETPAGAEEVEGACYWGKAIGRGVNEAR